MIVLGGVRGKGWASPDFLGAAAARLAVGPVSLSFLTPAIEKKVTHRFWAWGSVIQQAKLDDVLVAWRGSETSLEIRLIGVRTTDYLGDTLAAFPEIVLGFSPGAILRGETAPGYIEVKRPRVRLVRTYFGAVKFDIGADEPGASAELLEEFAVNLAIGSATPSSSFTRVAILDAEIILADEDNRTQVRISDADITIDSDPNGVRTAFELEVEAGAETVHLSAVSLYKWSDQRIDLGVELADLDPGRLAKIAPGPAWLEALAFPVSGTLKVDLDKFLGISRVDFDLTGGPGRLRLSDPFDVELDVTDARARGHVSDAFSTLRLDELFVDFGGPTLALRGGGTRGDETLAIDLEAGFTGVPVSTVAANWPAPLGDDLRQWLKTNLADGASLDATLAGTFGRTTRMLDLRGPLSPRLRARGGSPAAWLVIGGLLDAPEIVVTGGSPVGKSSGLDRLGD